MKIDHLWISATVAARTLSRSRDLAGRVFSSIEVDVTVDNDSGETYSVGKLECFLLDVESAEKYDDDIQEACDQEDGEVSMFAAFALTQTGLVRGRLLAFLDKVPMDKADDDDIDVANVLCVNGGWFALAPEVLAHVLLRLSETFRFEYAVVDMSYVARTETNAWCTKKDPTPKTVPPFVEIAFGLIDKDLLRPERSFWVVRVGDIKPLSDSFWCKRHPSG